MIGIKECPFCAEAILVDAKKCKYCNEFLNGYTPERILGDIKKVSRAAAIAVGIENGVSLRKTEDAVSQVLDQAKLAKALREEQYQVALSWDGQQSLVGFDLSGRNLMDSKLAQADLSKANLNEANLSKANLTGANLSAANLCEAFQVSTILRSANLSGANLHGAFLLEADLSKANLFGADLRDAKLIEVNLYRANLKDANLVFANLSKADLRGANLREALLVLPDLIWSTHILSSLVLTNLSGAKYDKETRWPEGFDPTSYQLINTDA